MVTPSHKNGWPVKLASADDARAIFTSLGGFAGSVQQTNSSAYLAERGTGGWITAPFSELREVEILNSAENDIIAEDSGLNEGLIVGRSRTPVSRAESNIYIRAFSSSAQTEVGPEFPRTTLAAAKPRLPDLASLPSASSNLKSVLFELAGPHNALEFGLDYLWPEDAKGLRDTTVENTGPLDPGAGFMSLYEYSGSAKHTPRLVGVDNSGNQISECGTSLGFPSEGDFSTDAPAELYNAVSADGSRVFFTAAKANQGPTGNAHACTGEGQGRGPSADELFTQILVNPATDAYETVAVSEPLKADCSVCSTTEPDDAVFQGASESGSKVFFLTSQALLPSDTDATTDLYKAEVGEIEDAGIKRFGVTSMIHASVGGIGDMTPGANAEVLGVVRVSEDGSHVYFVAHGVLTTTPNSVGDKAQLGGNNLYVYERDAKNPSGHTAFIGTLNAADSADWAQLDLRPVDATSDGHFLVFISSANLTPDDSSSVPQVFMYDSVAEKLVRISVGENGFNNNGNTTEYPARIVTESYQNFQNPAPRLRSMSGDGAYVVFESDDALTLGAAVGSPNVYEYHSGQVRLISDGLDLSIGQGESPSTSLLGIDESGKNIFFTTADQLVPQDGDTQVDIYDARVEGGFLPATASARCEGDECQGGMLMAPPGLAPGSYSQSAGEQIVEPRPFATRKIGIAKKKKSKRKLTHGRKQKSRKAQHKRHINTRPVHRTTSR